MPKFNRMSCTCSLITSLEVLRMTPCLPSYPSQSEYARRNGGSGVLVPEKHRCRRSDGFTASHVSAAEKLRKGLWMHTCPFCRISLCHAPRRDPSQWNAFLGPDASAAGNLDLGAGVQLI